MDLTPREQAVLTAALQNMLDSAGGDFGFTDEVVTEMAPMQPRAVGGVLSSLSQKGVLFIEEPRTLNDDFVVIQFTARDDIMQALYADEEPESIVRRLAS